MNFSGAPAQNKDCLALLHQGIVRVLADSMFLEMASLQEFPGSVECVSGGVEVGK